MTNKTKVLEIIDNVFGLDNLEDLKAVNNAISQRWKYIQRNQVFNFRVGQVVTWSGKRGKQIGEIIKVNTTSITVKTQDCEWKVSPSLLKVI